MKNPFIKWWLSIEEIVNIEEHKQAFINFLLDIQTDYRIQRAMWVDEWDKLLTWTAIIDDVISRMKRLEEAREEYYAKLKEAEQAKIAEQLAKKQ